MFITDENAIKVINQLFEKLTVIKPAFQQAWPNDGDFELAKKEWILAFKAANISSVEKLKRGIDRFRLLSCPFVPSPGEFISMCKPNAKELGLPDLDKAYQEACENSPNYITDRKWSHEAVKLAWISTGPSDLRSLPANKTKPIFQRHYEAMIELIANNQPLPDIGKSLVHNPSEVRSEVITKEGGEKGINMLWEALKCKKPKPS